MKAITSIKVQQDVLEVEPVSKPVSKPTLAPIPRLSWHHLMCAAQLGDNASYLQLLEQLRGYALSYCRKSSLHEKDLEDCVQEILVALHRARFSFDNSRPFMPWFKTILQHKVIDRIRKQARVLETELVAEASINSDKQEHHLLLDQLLSQINPRFAEPIRLTKIHGYSQDQVAARLQISLTALKMRVHRGMKMLQKVVRHEAKNLEREILYPSSSTERTDPEEVR